MKKLSDEEIARIAHEANRNYCMSLGDYSQLPWDAAPQWVRDSAINGVIFHRTHPHAGDSASHDNWMAEKLVAGWVYGEYKDPDASPPTHHCMVPFDQLPPDQQRKDRLFRSIIHAIIDPLR